MSSFYESLFRRALYPAYESGMRRRNTLRWLADYEQAQWLPAEQIARMQWDRLKQLLEHCHRDVPYYRRRWRELGVTPADIRNLDDYAQLPLLTKADIRAHFEELKSESLRDHLLYKATGGSTGEPLRFGYTRESNDRRTAVMWRGYGWAGSRMGRRTLFLWGGAVGHHSHAHRLKDRIYNAAFARHVLNSFHMTESNLGDYVDVIDRYHPEIIVAYVSPLVRLARWMLATGRKPSFRPQGIIGAAEPLHTFQRDLIEQAFGCPVWNTYGCREFMLVASGCERRTGLHVNADHLLLELVRPGSTSAHVASGEAGEVVITDLFNYGMPFIRYANGDMATPSATACACGRGLPTLTRVEGRVLDAIRTPDGHILPGEFFPHMLKEVPGVQRFQLVQRQLDRLDLAIVRGTGFDDASLAFIRNEISKVLGDSVVVDFHFVEDIPLTASGKLRVTVSELVAPDSARA
jgi:phenylacetate-CoA ligase